MLKLSYPLEGTYKISQTFAEHEAYARAHGFCTRPGSCPSGVYYYGGIDWMCPIGTPVHAAADGTVTEVGSTNIGYGRYVKIQHGDGLVTVYAHNSFLNVIKGDKVKTGDIISMSGSTGNSTGPHLHFEVRKDGIPVDPELYLSSEPPSEELPKLPAVATMNTVVNIRVAPNLVASPVGRTKVGDKFKVLEFIEGGLITWAKCEVYIAYKVSDDAYMEFPNE